MKILTFSTLFPNAAKPHHGIFTETTLRHQLATGEIDAKVVAPIPWFPFRHAAFGQYGAFARAPVVESRVGVDVFHPRYLAVPKVGMYVAPMSLAVSAKATIGRLIDEGFDFDVIDAHYFYPDGIAAILLGKYFRKPVIITALGTDINVILQSPYARRLIRWAGEQSAAMITVSASLKSQMVKFGMDESRITPLRNGVDLDLFTPAPRGPARARLGLEGFTLLSVGNLVVSKGHDLIISALPELPDTRLLIAGSGPDRKKFETLATAIGVADRVTFLGPLPQATLREYYAASDALVLASSREGWANVLLESMACGTPVIASDVGGTPELVCGPTAGVLMTSLTAEGVTNGVRDLRANYPENEATRRYAEGFSWEATTRGQIELFRRAAGRGGAPARAVLS